MRQSRWLGMLHRLPNEWLLHRVNTLLNVSPFSLSSSFPLPNCLERLVGLFGFLEALLEVLLPACSYLVYVAGFSDSV